MSRTRLVVGFVALVLCTCSWLVAQDKKTDKEPAPKLKGQLPAGWRKLGLSEEQIQKVYKVQADYRSRLDKLEEQVEMLKKQRQAEMEKVLSAAQKARLRELKDTDTDKEDPKKDERKPAEDKKKTETKK